MEGETALLSGFGPSRLDYPRYVSLHGSPCPQCGRRIFGPAELRLKDGVVQARCGGAGCGYAIDLFWVSSS